MQAKPELQKLFSEYAAMVGRANPDAAASLTLAHCILEVRDAIDVALQVPASSAKDARGLAEVLDEIRIDYFKGRIT